MDYISAAILGIVEGLTEFIPVSSTGHLLLLGHFIGFESKEKTFEVLIQLGAIMAILSVYAQRLLKVTRALPHDPAARNFVVGIVLAFLPAAIIGMLAHDFIKTILFESPFTICIALILGGIVLLVVDRLPLEPRKFDAMHYPWLMCLIIGFAQCLAMIPGVSRSGSTIVAALLLGANKRSAAEFSFFLAMPTMVGAFSLDLFRNYKAFSADDITIIAIGFVFAFITAVFVVRGLLHYVSKHGFALFGWWRIMVGVAGLIGLALVG